MCVRGFHTSVYVCACVRSCVWGVRGCVTVACVRGEEFVCEGAAFMCGCLMQKFGSGYICNLVMNV